MEDLFIKRGKRLREALNYLRGQKLVRTQKDMAQAIGATEANISAALKGNEKAATARLISRINEAYGYVFNEEYLLSGKGTLLAEDNYSMPESNDTLQEPAPVIKPTRNADPYRDEILIEIREKRERIKELEAENKTLRSENATLKQELLEWKLTAEKRAATA